MNNAQLKKKIASSGLYMWQVAKAVGISAGQLSVWFRDDPMTEDRQKTILKVIEKKEGVKE